MNCLRYSFAAALSVAVIVSLTTPTTSFADEEQPLIDLLKSDAPKADKAITCKKLALWGYGKSVPALAALLPDPELSSWARIALEVIPDPAADEALREASRQEIIRRYYRYACEYAIGYSGKGTVERAELIM